MRKIDPDDDELIYQLINNKSDKNRWDKIHALRMRPSQKLFQKCLALSKSLNTKERIIGIDILAQLGGSDRPYLNNSKKIFLQILDVENDPNILKTALFAIGHNNENLHNNEIDKILMHSKNNNVNVKCGIAFALLGIENDKAIDALINLSSDKSIQVRNWATFGIGSQISIDNQKIRDALWARVNDKHEETKFEAILGLAIRKDQKIIAVIKDVLQNKEYGSMIFEAILATNVVEFLPILQLHLEKTNNDGTISKEWRYELIDCIDKLSKIESTKGTIV